MQNVKISTSDSYRPSKIERLKDPEYAAAYLTAILEEKEPEPELLSRAIKDVIEAQIAINNLSQKDKLNWEKLEKMFLESGGSEIYSLITLLDVIGFKLTVTLK